MILIKKDGKKKKEKNVDDQRFSEVLNESFPNVITNLHLPQYI